jgi:hypothetical protein
MKSKKSNLFVVLTLGVGGLGGDLNEGMVTSCTNKFTLSALTGISRDRLAYVFTRKGWKVLVEGDYLIIRVDNIYMGRQDVRIGGGRFVNDKYR